MNTNRSVSLQGTITCQACGGTGKWPTLTDREGIHFACKGTGKLKEMSEKQYLLIRELFKEMVNLQIISEEEQASIIEIMLNHKQGLELQTSKWASNKIDEFKSRKNRHKNSQIKSRLKDEIVFETEETLSADHEVIEYSEEEVW